VEPLFAYDKPMGIKTAGFILQGNESGCKQNNWICFMAIPHDL
jgi:hypothetical protein